MKRVFRNNISSKGYHPENVKHLGRLPVDPVVTNRHLNISLFNCGHSCGCQWPKLVLFFFAFSLGAPVFIFQCFIVGLPPNFCEKGIWDGCIMVRCLIKSHRARSLPIWSVYGPWGVKKIKIPSTNSMGHRVVSCNVFHNYFQSLLQLGKNHFCPLSVPLWSAARSQTNRFGCFASSIHLNRTILKVPFANINGQQKHPKGWGFLKPQSKSDMVWCFHCTQVFSSIFRQLHPAIPRSLSLHRSHWQVLSARTFLTCST